MEISTECFSTEAKAMRRNSQIKRLGGFSSRVRSDGDAWVVEYWRTPDVTDASLQTMEPLMRRLDSMKEA
jgi:hypothetical protein